MTLDFSECHQTWFMQGMTPRALCMLGNALEHLNSWAMSSACVCLTVQTDLELRTLLKQASECWRRSLFLKFSFLLVLACFGGCSVSDCRIHAGTTDACYCV